MSCHRPRVVILEHCPRTSFTVSLESPKPSLIRQRAKTLRTNFSFSRGDSPLRDSQLVPDAWASNLKIWLPSRERQEGHASRRNAGAQETFTSSYGINFESHWQLWSRPVYHTYCLLCPSFDECDEAWSGSICFYPRPDYLISLLRIIISKHLETRMSAVFHGSHGKTYPRNMMP